MKHALVPHLPTPLARALQTFLDEDLPRSADELSELLVSVVAYVGAVAIADYLDGASDASRSAQDASLNAWLIVQLASGKAEAGHWAKWTKLAIVATRDPAIDALSGFAARQDIDFAESNLASLLAFRNRVMHGGFVAPLASIARAVRDFDALLGDLAPLWALRVVGRIDVAGEVRWLSLSGLRAESCPAPTIARTEWNRPGAVLLVDASHDARLALDPACRVGEDGQLEFQHDWRAEHPRLFERRAIHAFFERYQRERRGEVDATAWHEAVGSALPARGLVPDDARVDALLEALAARGSVVGLVGPVGSGRSTLARSLSDRADREIAVYAVEHQSIRQDPEVLARWTLQALSMSALGESAPVAALASDGEKAQSEWFARLAEAMVNRTPPILVVDDADRVGQGLYASAATAGCLRFARRMGASVLLIHRPSGKLPEAPDATFVVGPWEEAALAGWGDPTELAALSGGHVALLADRAAGIAALRGRLDEAERASPVHAAALASLRSGARTANEIAADVGIFAPRVELALRDLIDHLTVGRQGGQASGERTYRLHPAVAIALAEVLS